MGYQHVVVPDYQTWVYSHLDVFFTVRRKSRRGYTVKVCIVEHVFVLELERRASLVVQAELGNIIFLGYSSHHTLASHEDFRCFKREKERATFPNAGFIANLASEL